MPSSNVQKVLETLQENPQLVQKIMQVFTKVYEKAGVTLTAGEKAELFTTMGTITKKGGWVIDWGW